MPRHAEKKYRVDDFDEIIEKLSKLNARQLPASESHHYYAKQNSAGVVKLVVSLDKIEIHVLKEKNGMFTLIDRIPVKSKEAGVTWLKTHGFNDIVHIKMVHADHEYAGGIVGLYVINDKLNSVILDFPAKDHSKIAHEFGLENAEVIEKPYNQYLAELKLTS